MSRGDEGRSNWLALGLGLLVAAAVVATVCAFAALIRWMVTVNRKHWGSPLLSWAYVGWIGCLLVALVLGSAPKLGDLAAWAGFLGTCAFLLALVVIDHVLTESGPNDVDPSLDSVLSNSWHRDSEEQES